MLKDRREEKAAKKEAKELEKLNAILRRYGLEDIDMKYAAAVRDISAELAGSGLSEFGNLLSPDQKTSNRIMIQFLNSIMQQNWIIIRELDDIAKALRNK